jgi:hypothetical protein
MSCNSFTAIRITPAVLCQNSVDEALLRNLSRIFCTGKHCGMCKSDCEWYVRKLGMGRGRQRIWLKLHLEMDEARKEIVAIDFNDERCS